MTKKVKRTIKENEFLKAYIECDGNAPKAYKKVFPTVKDSSVDSLAVLLLTKLNLSISEMLNLTGSTDYILSQIMNEGLTAKLANNKPNYGIRAKYLDIILKLKAKYPIDETRLKLPGGMDKIDQVILKEIRYSKQGNKSIEARTKITQSLN